MARPRKAPTTLVRIKKRDLVLFKKIARQQRISLSDFISKLRRKYG